MFTSSSIIDNLNQSEGLEYKKLSRSLKIIKKSDKDKLDIALTALEKLEILEGLSKATKDIKKVIEIIEAIPRNTE